MNASKITATYQPVKLGEATSSDHWATAALRPIGQLSAEHIGRFISDRASSAPASIDYFISSLPVYVQLRTNGTPMFTAWMEDGPLFSTLHRALSALPAAKTIEICVTTAVSALQPSDYLAALSLKNCGRIGIEAELNGRSFRISPLQTIATNKPLERWFDDLLADFKLAPDGFFRAGGKLSVLQMRQFVVTLGKDQNVVETYRGAPIVPPESSGPELLDRVLQKMAAWFMSNIDEEGCLPYKYWPSRGEQSGADNPIRRFMATIALNRLGEVRADSSILRAARKNLAFNLARFYRQDDEIGQIYWDGSVKLGAVALAGLAILENSARRDWATQLSSLRGMVNFLWQRDGSFRTFYLPDNRNDNQNFYPGEALLFWAAILRREQDASLMERALKSLDFYREHFNHQPNPAFVPWHTQAAAILYRLTRRNDLRDYVFEMNDWLVPHQQWGGSLDIDLWGRFYSPHISEYGPPHASSTGVYMEGMADALELAIEAKDSERAKTYERVLFRGLRSIAQLQFQDRSDAFYMSKPARVIGGVRTEAYDNEIRIDNIQHALMALLKFKSVLTAAHGKASGSELTPAVAS